MRVEPDGPVPNYFAIFGEAPGYEELIEGRGFVGKSGQELWAGIKRHVGLAREDFYVSNLVKEDLPKNRDPKPQEIAAALPEFLDELERVNPRIIVTAGGFSTRACLGPVNLATVHGIPHVAEIAGRTRIIHPVYHPAAGLHNKSFLAAFAYDLKQLKRLLDGSLRPWKVSDRPLRTSWLSDELGGLPKAFRGVVGIDTEGWTARPWGLSFSLDGETGYVIRAGETDLLRRFSQWLKGKTVVGHNIMHDIPVLRAMGINLLDGPFHDTQILAFHEMVRTGSGILEAESQNLGTLAYRRCELVLGELTDLPGVDLDEQTIPYSDEARHYAGMDAIAAWRLFQTYRDLVSSAPYQIDIGQVPLVEEMIAVGLPFDTNAAFSYYTEVLEKLDTVTQDLRKKAARLGNRDFNPGSHPQVRELLTRRIGLRIRKRTRGGKASTNEKALADHKDNEFVQKLQTHRELIKLRGTYLAPLLKELQ